MAKKPGFKLAPGTTGNKSGKGRANKAPKSTPKSPSKKN